MQSTWTLISLWAAPSPLQFPNDQNAQPACPTKPLVAAHCGAPTAIKQQLLLTMAPVGLLGWPRRRHTRWGHARARREATWGEPRRGHARRRAHPGRRHAWRREATRWEARAHAHGRGHTRRRHARAHARRRPTGREPRRGRAARGAQLRRCLHLRPRHHHAWCRATNATSRPSQPRRSLPRCSHRHSTPSWHTPPWPSRSRVPWCCTDVVRGRWPLYRD
mmetsp:Transcript_38181/g.96644  ORF Transcript_38181/g.96644 Transcript_38181/m.96644 type:complete len:220 (-) Transcript_38181:411-1070(-)